MPQMTFGQYLQSNLFSKLEKFRRPLYTEKSRSLEDYVKFYFIHFRVYLKVVQYYLYSVSVLNLETEYLYSTHDNFLV